MLYDLIYTGSATSDKIKEKYPDAIIKDASDYIHEERFEVEIPSLEPTDQGFYEFLWDICAIMHSFTFNLWTMGGPGRPDWLTINWVRSRNKKIPANQS